VTDALPNPLVPAEVDLRDFQFTPIFRSRLFGSSFHARSTDAEWRAGVTLWLKSWDQVPAGTLPDDDIDLCRLAELGRDMRSWQKVKTGAMHGWRRCSDGRLHHSVVAEGVLEAWERRSAAKKKGIAGASKRWGTSNTTTTESDGTSISTGNASAIARAMPGDSKGQGQGQGQGQENQTSLSSALPIPNCPQQEIIGLYGEILPMLTQPRDWSSARAGALQARWKYCAKANGFSPGYGTKDEGIAFWRKYFSYVSNCEKLTGKMPPRKPGDEPWKPDLPWLVKAENFLKVIEGKYAS
jgi:hypothetical protein